MHTIKNTIADFIKSFKLGEKFVSTWVYDAVFYAVIILLYSLLASFVSNSSGVSEFTLAQAAASPELASQAAQEAMGVFFSFGVGVFLIPIVFIALYSISRGFIWGKISSKKFSLKMFWKFFGANISFIILYLPSFVVWALLVVGAISVIGFGPAVTAFVIFISIALWLHLLTSMHFEFAEKEKAGKAMIGVFTIGFGKIKHFIIPYLLSFIVFVVWVQLARLIYLLNSSQSVNALLFFAVIIAPYLAWLRIYMNWVIKKVIERNE